jgi:crossover junction endonuclease MUS81
MRLIVDNREHALIERCEAIISNDQQYVTLEIDTLPIGDILVKTDEGKDVMIVERKTLQDLLASIKDGRYEEQSHRLKHASGFPSHNVVYIIEGMFSTLRTMMEKKIVISTIASLNYFKGFSVIRTSSVQETAEVLIYMADKIDRNFMKGILPSYLIPEKNILQNTMDVASLETNVENTVTSSQSNESYSGFVKKVKRDNITPDNMGEIMLCQIPGISTSYAKAILTHFEGFSKLVEKVKDGSSHFENIFYEDSKGSKRRIPKSCGIEIMRFMQFL